MRTRFDYALNAAQRADARAALKLLDGLMSLEDAAKIAVQGKRAGKRVTLADAIDLFQRSREGVREKTAAYYSCKLKRFVEWSRASDYVDSITHEELRDYIASAKTQGRATRASSARVIRSCWQWMLKQRPPLAGVDITHGLETTAPASEADVKFLTVDQCKLYMSHAGNHRAALALMLFAGIRPEEVAGEFGKARMTWGCIDPAAGTIRIPAACSKTRKGRVIEGLPGDIFAWLGKPCAADEPISAEANGVNARRYVTTKSGIKDWPHDALRHSFASYATAFTSDPGKVALWLGHEGKPTMLFRHYRGLATKAQAEAFFALRPTVK